MPDTAKFSPGDVVVHPRRPEWGDGVVVQAMGILHKGQSAQRLTVRFTHRNRVTINTAVAPLMAKETYNAMRSNNQSTSGTSTATGGWLSSLEQDSADHELWRLPEAMTDPFSSLGRRLNATLDSYRFSTEARSLTAWAVAQTGLDDPLSKYTRQKLEQAFPRFARDRDNQLQDLVNQIKCHGERELLDQALANTRVPAARETLKRMIRG